METYYEPPDLPKFGEIAEAASRQGKKFFDYYGAVFAEGQLNEREKALIAIAVAHTIQCPYCIDAFTESMPAKGLERDRLEAGPNRREMMDGETVDEVAAFADVSSEDFDSGSSIRATLKSTFRISLRTSIPVPWKGSCAARLSPSCGMDMSMIVILIWPKGSLYGWAEDPHYRIREMTIQTMEGIAMEKKVTWETDMKEASARARAESKHVLLDFFNPG